MADTTGAPWNLPYPEDTDLVRDGASDIEALAVATAAGLSAAGGLVAVKSALFTGTQTASVTASSNVAVTDLTITHTLADAANKLIISAYLGAAANSEGYGNVGLGVADDATLIALGASAGSRSLVGAGGLVSSSDAVWVTTMPSVTFVYEPGDTSSHTYTVRAINIVSATRTIYINRSENDADSQNRQRAASGFVIQEVQV
jgi:hypothetical protein